MSVSPSPTDSETEDVDSSPVIARARSSCQIKVLWEFVLFFASVRGERTDSSSRAETVLRLSRQSLARRFEA
jgi:hypothetical protein